MRIPHANFLDRDHCAVCERPWYSGGPDSAPTREHPIARLIGGLIESRMICDRCNSGFGTRVDTLLLQSDVVRAAVFDLRTESVFARGLDKRLARPFNRWRGDQRDGRCIYRKGSEPQYRFILREGVAGPTIERVFPERELHRWWRTRRQELRRASLVVGDGRDFLHAAYELRRLGSVIPIPVPGEGELNYEPNGQAEYEFRPTISWQPLAKMLVLLPILLNHNLDFTVITRKGELRAPEFLHALAKGETPASPWFGEPTWPEDGFTCDLQLRWESEAHGNVSCFAYVFGVACGGMNMRVLSAPEVEHPFFHYVLLPETKQHLAYFSPDAYAARGECVHLHDPEVQRSIREEIEANTLRPRHPEPDASDHQ